MFNRPHTRTGRAKHSNTLIIRTLTKMHKRKKCKVLYSFFTLSLYTLQDTAYRNRSSKTVCAASLRRSSIEPSWFRMICREMERPMPEPSFLVV